MFGMECSCGANFIIASAHNRFFYHYNILATCSSLSDAELKAS